MKKLIITVGLPGSGKNYTADKLVEEANQNHLSSIICSTDDFFMVDGVYKWNATKLYRNHKRCEERARKACADGIDLVLIVNTNLWRKVRKVYESIAAEFGYEVEHKIVGDFTPEFAAVCAARNQHNVSLEQILKMAKKVQLPEPKG